MSRPLRIALLDGAGAPASATLAAALRADGHGPSLLTTRPAHAPAGVDGVRLRVLPERPLRARAIGDGLERLPHALLVLARGRFDVVHAFTPVDALAAVTWARRGRGRGPALLTLTEPLRRETIANRRLRVETLEAALAGADAVLAAGEDVRASMRRLLALEADCLAPGDAVAHVSLYRRLGAGQGRASTA